MSANSLDEMIAKIAGYATTEGRLAAPDWGAQNGAPWVGVPCHEIRELVLQVRAALAPHLPVEMPERPKHSIIPNHGNGFSAIYYADQAEAYFDALEAEVKRLRMCLIEVGRDAGCFLADEVSTDFLMGVPHEVRAKLATSKAELEKMRSLADRATEGMEQAKKRAETSKAELEKYKNLEKE